jgi:hypothetical protein
MLDLGRLNQLRTLAIAASYLYEHTEPATTLVLALQSVRSALLETATLYVDEPERAFFERMYWSALRKAVECAKIYAPRMVVLLDLCIEEEETSESVIPDLAECERVIAQAKEEFGMGTSLQTRRVQKTWAR